MNILITNDDGITSRGLLAAKRALDAVGTVSVIAPDSNRSAVGRGITIDRPLTVVEVTGFSTSPYLVCLVVATAIVSILLMMSLILMATTLFSQINVRELTAILGGGLVATFAVGGFLYARSLRRKPPEPVTPMAKRATWRMPALNLLERPTWSRGRLWSMYLLRAYLVVAVVLLLVKAIQLGLGTSS